jgi:hypothetical protein
MRHHWQAVQTPRDLRQILLTSTPKKNSSRTLRQVSCFYFLELKKLHPLKLLCNWSIESFLILDPMLGLLQDQ